MVHGRRGWWVLRAPGSKPSAMTRPGTSYGVCSHDGGMAGGGELSGSWGTALQHGCEHKELGDKVSGSRRVRRCRRWGRGGSGRGESSDGDRRHRGWRRRPGRRCSAPLVAWLGVDEEDDDAVLLDWSARRVVVGGRGYSERRRRRLSGELEEESQGRESGGPERERRSRGSRASPWRREGVGEAATAKQEVEASACARACGVRPPGRGGRGQGGGGGGLGRPDGLASWAR